MREILFFYTCFLIPVFYIIGNVYLCLGWRSLAWHVRFVGNDVFSHDMFLQDSWGILVCNWEGQRRGCYVMAVHTCVLRNGGAHGILRNDGAHMGCYIILLRVFLQNFIFLSRRFFLFEILFSFMAFFSLGTFLIQRFLSALGFEQDFSFQRNFALDSLTKKAFLIFWFGKYFLHDNLFPNCRINWIIALIDKLRIVCFIFIVSKPCNYPAKWLIFGLLDISACFILLI